jgi:hypothetical protein
MVLVPRRRVVIDVCCFLGHGIAVIGSAAGVLIHDMDRVTFEEIA